MSFFPRGGASRRRRREPARPVPRRRRRCSCALLLLLPANDAPHPNLKTNRACAGRPTSRRWTSSRARESQKVRRRFLFLGCARLRGRALTGRAPLFAPPACLDAAPRARPRPRPRPEPPHLSLTPPPLPPNHPLCRETQSAASSTSGGPLATGATARTARAAEAEGATSAGRRREGTRAAAAAVAAAVAVAGAPAEGRARAAAGCLRRSREAGLQEQGRARAAKKCARGADARTKQEKNKQPPAASAAWAAPLRPPPKTNSNNIDDNDSILSDGPPSCTHPRSVSGHHPGPPHLMCRRVPPPAVGARASSPPQRQGRVFRGTPPLASILPSSPASLGRL